MKVKLFRCPNCGAYRTDDNYCDRECAVSHKDRVIEALAQRVCRGIYCALFEDRVKAIIKTVTKEVNDK